MHDIKVFDNFLPQNQYENMRKYAIDREELFRDYQIDTDVFMKVLELSPGYLHTIYRTIEKANHSRITHIAGYYRLNTSEVDTKERIHCDYDILGQKPTRAAVLYLCNNSLPPNKWSGTAFWKHKYHGNNFEGTPEENQKLLLGSAANKFTKEYEVDFIVNHAPNRLVTYPASYFHSRLPAQAWGETVEDGRLIIVLFYREEIVE